MSAATGVSLSGPGAGYVNNASTTFTVALTPTGGTSSGDTITPASTLAGVFTPTTVSLSTGTPSATFTFTPSVQGSHSISITDSASLTMPSPLTYLVLGASPSVQQCTGDAVSPNRSASLAIVPNTFAPVAVTITSLPGPLTAAALAAGINAANLSLLTKAALIIDPGTVQSNGTYTAKVVFELLETDTAKLVTSSLPYVMQVTATVSTAGGSHTEPVIDNLQWTSIAG